MIAFLTWLAEAIGEDSRFVHLGMTSSDVLDTCLSVQLTQAADLLLADLDAVLAALKARALEHKYTLTIGRSHGIHAEPTTFGLKLAGHYAEFARNRARLVAARAEVAVAAISGAGRARSRIVDPRVEEYVAAKLGLAPEPISTQVIPRDRHAMFFATLAVIAVGHGAAGDRGAASAAQRGARGGGVLPSRPEGLLVDAAQAQPGAEREPDRSGARGARRGGAGAGERDAVARARHLPLRGRAGDRARMRRSRWISRWCGWPG